MKIFPKFCFLSIACMLTLAIVKKQYLGCILTYADFVDLAPERFSYECRKTKSKLTNQNRSKRHDGPIRT